MLVALPLDPRPVSADAVQLGIQAGDALSQLGDAPLPGHGSHAGANVLGTVLAVCAAHDVQAVSPVAGDPGARGWLRLWRTGALPESDAAQQSANRGLADAVPGNRAEHVGQALPRHGLAGVQDDVTGIACPPSWPVALSDHRGACRRAGSQRPRRRRCCPA